MKRYILVLGIVFFLMFALPFFAMGSSKNNLNRDLNEGYTKINSTNQMCDAVDSENATNTFKIENRATGEITYVDDKEFVYGVVAAEMPITFEREAIKAQSIAAFTFYSNSRKKAREGLEYNYDLSVDEGNKIYLSTEQMKERWGNHFDEYYQKLSSCVDEVFPKVIKYKGELIVATFHAISGGYTESSKDIFGGATDYLVPVPSSGDLLAPDYNTCVSFSIEEFKTIISQYFGDTSLNDNPGTWITDMQRTSSGAVLSIKIGDSIFFGDDIRSAFSLRSSNFDVSFDGSSFNFDVRGYGHGVGMSQYGAQYMAKQGASYANILKWYYPNTYIE